MYKTPPPIRRPIPWLLRPFARRPGVLPTTNFFLIIGGIGLFLFAYRAVLYGETNITTAVTGMCCLIVSGSAYISSRSIYGFVLVRFLGFLLCVVTAIFIVFDLAQGMDARNIVSSVSELILTLLVAAGVLKRII
jgi:hypothetical protein